jgi:hypothetical protein
LSSQEEKRKKKFYEEIDKLGSIKDIYKIENAWKKIRINKRKRRNACSSRGLLVRI